MAAGENEGKDKKEKIGKSLNSTNKNLNKKKWVRIDGLSKSRSVRMLFISFITKALPSLGTREPARSSRLSSRAPAVSTRTRLRTWCARPRPTPRRTRSTESASRPSTRLRLVFIFNFYMLPKGPQFVPSCSFLLTKRPKFLQQPMFIATMVT